MSSERIVCPCGNDRLGPTDYDIIDGKIVCWRCRYWFKNSSGNYEQKRIYAKDSPYKKYLAKMNTSHNE